ncbi:MAG: efflux RND transporter periplasmic adaptor subunit [Deltaproteobacteria bacterium]|nr:efflux RND transporter periplasmic adaptor subunit [Deltaproteobacteria bacterium]
MDEQKTGKDWLMSWIVILIAVGFLVLAFYNFRRSQREKISAVKEVTPVPVAVVKAEETEMERLLETSGDLRSRVNVYVFPKVAGRVIEKILVDKGDRVKKGQLLVILDASLVKARMERANAATDAARSQLELLQKDRQRLEFLFAHKAAPRQRLDRISAQYKAAAAGLREAEAVRREIQVLLADHAIKAEIDGVVAERFFDPGNLSDTKKPLLRLTDESLMKIELAAPETYFPRLRLGMQADFQVAAYPQKLFHASLVKMNPVFDPATRTVKLELQAANDGHLLRSGMYAQVRLHLGSRKVLAIPREALNRLPGSGSYYVFVIDDGRAHQLNIKVGLQQGERVEVISGLQPGELVVVKGQNRLQEGIPVVLRGNQPQQKERQQ